MDLYRLISKAINSILVEDKEYSVARDIDSYAHFYQYDTCDREKLIEICKFLINLYKSMLKKQRDGQDVCNNAKINCQILNYYLQNIVDKNKYCPEGYEIKFQDVYKPWDAVVSEIDNKIYVVDSSGLDSFKVYNFDGQLIYKYNAELPTKVVLLNGHCIAHSTYSPRMTLLINGDAYDLVHLCPIRVCYEYGGGLFIIDDEWDIYEIIFTDGIRFKYYKSLSSNDFYVDSYCQKNNVIYCCSHTSSKVLAISITDFSIEQFSLEGVYMPNSIENLADLFVISDKETGYLSVFDSYFNLKHRFGKFSKKHMGNADTTIAVPYFKDAKLNIMAFSWLKDSCTIFKKVEL